MPGNGSHLPIPAIEFRPRKKNLIVSKRDSIGHQNAAFWLLLEGKVTSRNRPETLFGNLATKYWQQRSKEP